MQWNESKRMLILKGIYGLGYVLLMLGTIFYYEKLPVAPFLFSLGAVFLLVVRVVLPIDSTNYKTKRLNMIHAFSTLVLLASAYGMFVHYYLWIAGLLLSTLIDLYVSFRLPKKEEQ
jgi:hypothetical protein